MAAGQNAAPRAVSLVRIAGLFVWVVLAGLLGAAIAIAATSLQPPLSYLIIPGLALAVCVTVLAYGAPAATTVAAFALLAVVRSEPAPSDVIFGILILTAVAGGRVLPIRVPPATGIGLVLWCFVSVLSIVNAVDMAGAARFEAISLYLVALAIFIAAIASDGPLLRRCMLAYIWSAIVSAILAIGALKVPGFPARDAFLYDPSRAMALFKDPNVFGPYLVPAAAILAEELIRPRLLGWRTWAVFVAFCVVVTGNVFAFSRAGWLNLGVACIVVVGTYAMRRRGFGRAVKLVLVLAVCGAVGFVFLAATGSLAFLQERSKLQAYDTDRFANQASGLSHATAHVLGYGPGQAEHILAFSTHSLPIRLLVEQGILGAVLFAIVLAGTVAAGIGWAARDGDLHGIGSAAMLGSFLGLLANCPFVDTLHWRHLWLVMALIWAGSRLDGGTAHARPDLRGAGP
jgi:hypothetical protein